MHNIRPHHTARRKKKEWSHPLGGVRERLRERERRQEGMDGYEGGDSAGVWLPMLPLLPPPALRE